MTLSNYDLVISEVNQSLPLRKLNDLIARMDLSADAKALLADLAKISVQVGATVVHIGRKILTLAVEIVKRFPNTVFGIVVTVAIGLLLGSAGLVGTALAPLVTPLMLIFAVTKGMMADFSQAAWAESLRDLERRLAQKTVQND